ncbi:hypothetical protein [Pseudonocardia cypriaca]|uniref:hypothetical protein n=1 Tax=Pseudonocardia cypriaca TaxID=882449 RepID=UPI001152D93E|nr:hypothetical protein [Pseudonocardia cypriaca]
MLLGMPLGMLVTLVLVVAIGIATNPTLPTNLSAASGSVAAPAATVLPAPAPPAPSGPLTTFGDGTWEVGVDIVPGKYKTSGPAPSGFGNCYHARLKTGDGSVGDILDNNNSKGPVTVTIKESDGYFESQGCADWVKAD